MIEDYRCWVYHADCEPMIVTREQAEKLYKEGWSDTPATFAKTTDFGIDPDDAANVQALGDTVEGIKDRLNDELNFDVMSRKELRDYAMRHHDVEVKLTEHRGDAGTEKLREFCRKLAAGEVH